MESCLVALSAFELPRSHGIAMTELRAVQPGKTKRGNNFDTCCRPPEEFIEMLRQFQNGCSRFLGKKTLDFLGPTAATFCKVKAKDHSFPPENPVESLLTLSPLAIYLELSLRSRHLCRACAVNKARTHIAG